jgi:hypothetical protein
MRTYQLYLIEKEFASHYFGKEKLFFQLFHELDNANGGYRMILQKQIDFITKPIPILKIHQFIKQSLQKNKIVYTKKGTYYLELGNNSHAELDIQEKRLILNSSGHYEAETAFFEVLRKAEASFLAIDLENQHCGWLKPIKERKFV